MTKPRRVGKAPIKRRRSREFEQWVAHIEGTLTPAGATLKSPDRIRDKFTGQYPEVDATVRFRVGSADILIAIECRERSRVQDVTWVEQLATKRAHIGADRTIAVSSTPFTDAAKKAAAHQGISLRRIADLTAAEVLARGPGLEVSVTSLEVVYGRLALGFSGSKAFTLDQPSRDLFSAKGWDAQIFTTPSGVVSLHGLMRTAKTDDVPLAVQGALTLPPNGAMALTKNDPLSPYVQDIPDDGKPVGKTLTITFGQDSLTTVSTTEGEQRLATLAAEFTVTRKTEPVEPSRVSDYSDEHRVLGRYTEHRVEIDGKTYTVWSHPGPATEQK